jgi:tetratricopeptide (TPR) repeat protein
MSEAQPPGAHRTEHLKNHCDRAASLLQSKRVDAAMIEYREALGLDPDCVAAHIGLAVCWEHKGKIDDAMTEYVIALQTDNLNVQARYGIGTLFLTRGKINEAINQFMTVLKLDPQHVQARLSIGKCLEKKNQPGDALQDYRNIEASDPDCSEAYVSAARCLIRLDRGPDAVDEFRKAIVHMPSRLDLRLALIRLLEEQGYIEEAIREYREILARTPDAVDIRLDLASVMDRGGLIKEVIGEYARVLELDPKNAFAYKKHANLLREREKIDMLTDRYLGYVINRMEKIGDHFREGMKMYLDGCFDEALGEFVAEATQAPRPEAHFGTGACLVRAGSLLTAVPQFREAIKFNPDLKEAHTMLGILYERHGLLYEASEEYELGVKEALDRIKSGEEIKRKVDMRESEPSFNFFQLI